MQMRMMLEVLTPGVKHRKEADFGAQMLGVGGDGLQCSCRGLAQNAVDHLLILVGKGGDLRRDGEHDMKVGAVQELGLTVFEPLGSRQTLTFGTMPIAAAIVGIAFVATLITAFHVAAESGGTAHFDGGHDASLLARHRRAMLLTIGFTVAAEHVRHFPARRAHGAWLRAVAPKAWWGDDPKGW